MFGHAMSERAVVIRARRIKRDATLFALRRRLLANAFACIAVSLTMCSSALKTPSRGPDDPFPLPDERNFTAPTSMGSESPREPVSLTNSQTELRLNISHDYQARILECSHAIRVEGSDAPQAPPAPMTQDKPA